jgi:hypothetical protein
VPTAGWFPRQAGALGGSVIKAKARRMTTQVVQRRHPARGHKLFRVLYLEPVKADDHDT